MTIRQFDVFLNPSKRGAEERPYVIVLQCDAFADKHTRLTCPLVTPSAIKPIRRLNPEFTIRGDKVFLSPTQIGGLPAALLQSPIASLADHRDAIIAAIDLVFTGI